MLKQRWMRKNKSLRLNDVARQVGRYGCCRSVEGSQPKERQTLLPYQHLPLPVFTRSHHYWPRCLQNDSLFASSDLSTFHVRGKDASLRQIHQTRPLADHVG